MLTNTQWHWRKRRWNICDRCHNSQLRYFECTEVFSDTLLNSRSALYTNMFDFLPLPCSKTSLGNVWIDHKRERFHAVPREARKKASTACRIDRVWRERWKIKRERNRTKKKEKICNSLPAGQSTAKIFRYLDENVDVLNNIITHVCSERVT